MPPPIRPPTSPSGLAAPEFSWMEPPPPPGASYHAPPPPPPPLVRPPGPPMAPTPPVAATATLKRKGQGSHLVQSGAPGAAVSSVAPASVPRASPKRKKTASTGPTSA
nr:sulfated surface glycoprotein 185-like [Aegilops tauschii subsp. strangulata]